MRALFRRLLAALAGRLGRKAGKNKAAAVAAKVVTYAMTAAGFIVMVLGTGDPLLSPLLGIGFIGTGTLALTMMWRTKEVTVSLHERFDRIDEKLDGVRSAVNQNTEAINGMRDSVDGMRDSVDGMRDSINENTKIVGDKLDKVIELLGRGTDVRP